MAIAAEVVEQFESLPKQAQREAIDFIAFLAQRHERKKNHQRPRLSWIGAAASASQNKTTEQIKQDIMQTRVEMGLKSA